MQLRETMAKKILTEAKGYLDVGFTLQDIHVAIERYFKKYFHPDMVRVSKEEAFPR